MFNELKFTPGVGLSLLIGAVGSIYLIVQSHRYISKLSQRRRSEIQKPDVVCYMCNANIEVEQTNSFATCRGCERLVCRSEEKQCCEWIPAIGIWECRNCHSSRVIQQKAGEWLLNQLTSRLQNPGPVKLHSEGLLGLGGTDSDDAKSTTSSIPPSQQIKVREFVEELLSSMLNGPLDDVSVGQLMGNESYLPLFEGQTEPSSPSDTHFELRKMLQKILDEVAKLPELLNHSGFPLRPEEHLPYFSPKKYEQLLATAVLNKVVEDYRNPKNFEHVNLEADKAGPPTTGATSVGSAPATETTLDVNHNKVPGLLSEANLRKMSLDKELKEDLYGRSLSESDESYLSDYIQKHTVPLPDLSDTTGSGPEDDVLSLKSNATDGTWEENWLFKKRQLKSTESSIAMLVPSPTEEVKALIGDKNADEVSDLSEAGSDVEEYDSDSNIKNTTTTETNSSPKRAENSIDSIVQDSLISINSIASNEPLLSEAKNDLLLEEQTMPEEFHGNLVDDLISIEPCSIKTEAANPALMESKLISFISGPESVLIEENNNILKQEEVVTDDVKLMQERIQNAPKKCDDEDNVLHPIGIVRTIPVDGHSSECDRKEVPIDRAQPNSEHTTRPIETVSEVNVNHPNINHLSINLNPSNLESKSPTTQKIGSKLEPSPPIFVEPLSPHPIVLNITEIFERSMKVSLKSISEEDLESNASTAFQSLLSPSDSIVSTADGNDCKTISQHGSDDGTTAMVDTDNSLLLNSLPSLQSFSSSLESTRHYQENEFSSINDSAETSKKSLDLLELDQASSGAVYVCDTSNMHFAEQLRELRQQQVHQTDTTEESEEKTIMDKNEKISIGQNLVAFNKNAPSPDELNETDEEKSQHSDVNIEKTREAKSEIIKTATNEDIENQLSSRKVEAENSKSNYVKDKTLAHVVLCESQQINLNSPANLVHNVDDVPAGTTETLDESDNELLKSNDGLPSQSGSSSPTDTSTEAVAGSADRVSSPEDSFSSINLSEPIGMNNDPTIVERPQSTAIAVVTEQMRQYCEELKDILNQRKIPELSSKPSEEIQQTSESWEQLLALQEELRIANKDPSQNEIKPCKDHPIQSIAIDCSKVPVSESLPNPMDDFVTKSAIYNDSLRNTQVTPKFEFPTSIVMPSQNLVDTEDPESIENGSVHCSTLLVNTPEQKDQAVNVTEIIPTEENKNIENVIEKDNGSKGTDLLNDSPVTETINKADDEGHVSIPSAALTESSKSTIDEEDTQSPSTNVNNGRQNELRNTSISESELQPSVIDVVTEQISHYSDELKDILNLKKPPEPRPISPETQIVENIETLELLREELRLANEDPSQTVVTPCKGHSMKSIPVEVSASESFPSPMEEFAIQSALYNDRLRSLEPEEIQPIVEDASSKVITNLGLSDDDKIETSTPSVEEDQIKSELIECEGVNVKQEIDGDIFTDNSNGIEADTFGKISSTHPHQSAINDDNNADNTEPLLGEPLTTLELAVNSKTPVLDHENEAAVGASLEENRLSSESMPSDYSSPSASLEYNLPVNIEIPDQSELAELGTANRVSRPEDSSPPTTVIDHNQLDLQDSSNGLIRTSTPDEKLNSTAISVVTEQTQLYCEELKNIVKTRQSPDVEFKIPEAQLQTPKSLQALEFFQKELLAADEDPSQTEIKPCKDHPIQTVTSDRSKSPVTETLPTPMEEFAVQSALYNHHLRNIDYVEEGLPNAEDAACFLTANIELSNAKEIVTTSPSAGEHAVQEAVTVEHTPIPAPNAVTEISYERQVTTTVEELQSNQNCPLDDLESSDEPSGFLDSLEVTSSVIDETPDFDRILSSDVLEPTETNDIPRDSNVSSISVTLPAVCVLTNNGDTNLTNVAESDTNNLCDDQLPSFISEASIPIEEPDLFHYPQIPAPPAPQNQKPSETSSGHAKGSTANSAEDERLIPGSIAEREHLKWRNASPIANNPYSPDVLQKRLEESNRHSNVFDFDRLAGRDPTSPTLEVPDDPDPQVASKEEEDAVEKDRSLQSVIGSNPNQYQRYGRDYYINDAKRASGSRKQTPDLPTQLTHSTDDEKSLLLSRKQDQQTSPTPTHQRNDSKSAGTFPFVKSSSCGNVVDDNQTEDIFSAARPIEVKPDDPILKRGIKMDYLSTPTREVYLVPAEDPATPQSLGSSSELSMTSRADDSLTYSEDSDVTRIYEIGTCESKVIHGDVIGGGKDTGQTPPSTPTNGDQLVNTSHPIDEEQTMNKLNCLKLQESEVLSEEILEIIPQIRVPTPIESEPLPEEPSSPTIDRSRLLKPHLLKNKPLSPETIKFFSPKKPFATNLTASSSLSQSSMEIRDLPHNATNLYHSSLHIDYPPTRPVPLHHDFIIEKEVMEVLPSVKELAKCYSVSQQDVSKVPQPLHKPRVKLRKDFIRQSSEMLHAEEDQEARSGMPHVPNKNRRMYCSTSSITTAEEIRESRRTNVEAYNPPTFVPMAPGHSITARSLSKQIRDELKINATDDHKVQGGHTSPERPSSPVFAPGHLRSSIQFFESLRDK